MKQKEFKKISLNKNPYHLFTTEENFHSRRNDHTKLPGLSKYKTINNKMIVNNPLLTYNSRTSKVSSVTKSLKKVALNSNLYGNYIDFYVNLTQDNYFKTPYVDSYPLLKNKDYLSIKLQNLTERKSNDSSKEKLSLSKTNSIFLSYLKSTKTPKIYNQRNLTELNYSKNKMLTEKYEIDDSANNWKDFSELCYENLFESKFLKKNKLKKVDINNCFTERQNNFNFFHDYIKKVAELKDIFSDKNYHRNIIFNGRTLIKKEKLEFKLDIYSLCFKFFSLNDNNNSNNVNKQKECQKLYFPFVLMPFFYLLDFNSFKALLSEIIIYNKNNRFEYIKEKLLIKTLKKYISYIDNSLDNDKNFRNNITYNKKETIFPLVYDWIVTNFLNEENKENNDIYKCFKLKIVLPKIKFSINNLKIKINKYLNKHIIADLLKNKFKKWKKFIFFDLFSTKRFKIIMNIIMLNMYYKIPLKKINLNPKYQILNKNYEFFLTKIGENNSFYYALITYIILMIFGQKKKKKFQKIILNLKECINLIKFQKCWGIINTLFKCMSLDKMKNDISFKLYLLEMMKMKKLMTLKKKGIK